VAGLFFAQKNIAEMFHWAADSATLSCKFHGASLKEAFFTATSGKKFAQAA
jgi:hypothetical protein